MSTEAKDLTKDAPRSPRIRIRGYAILARAIDKGRADLAGTIGEFHFACPLDMMLFDFKGVAADDVKKLIAEGASDEEIAAWIDSHGLSKGTSDLTKWSDRTEAYRPYDDPEKKDWFIGVCKEVGIDPEKSTLFDYLDADDKLCFPQV